jgi:hypothetical protein
MRPSDRWEYVFHQWLGTQAEGLADGGTALWTGIDQYLYWAASDTWKWGARFEWFQDTDGTRVGLNRPSNPNLSTRDALKRAQQLLGGEKAEVRIFYDPTKK